MEISGRCRRLQLPPPTPDPSPHGRGVRQHYALCFSLDTVRRALLARVDKDDVGCWWIRQGVGAVAAPHPDPLPVRTGRGDGGGAVQGGSG